MSEIRGLRRLLRRDGATPHVRQTPERAAGSRELGLDWYALLLQPRL